MVHIMYICDYIYTYILVVVHGHVCIILTCMYRYLFLQYIIDIQFHGISHHCTGAMLIGNNMAIIAAHRGFSLVGSGLKQEQASSDLTSGFFPR